MHFVVRFLAVATLDALVALSVGAQRATLAVAPAHPQPGAIVRLTVRDSGGRADSIVALRGTAAGEPLHFARGKTTYRAFAGVPVDSGAIAAIEIVLERASGRADTLRDTIVPPPLPPPVEQLSVSALYGTPFDSATTARIDSETRRAEALGRRSQAEAPFWTLPFQRPRSTPVTSTFGSGRTFNGRVTTRHFGVDLRGRMGEPVFAANRGVVALVDTTVLGGRVVYVDHGGGLVTAYMHLSKPLVVAGDTVKRGQRIGLVGATGRVTGPHLHWGARYGALTVNPLDLLGLQPPIPAMPDSVRGP